MQTSKQNGHQRKGKLAGIKIYRLSFTCTLSFYCKLTGLFYRQQQQQQTNDQGISAKDYAVQQAKYKLSSAAEHLEVSVANSKMYYYFNI